jgi:hypothetical protein
MSIATMTGVTARLSEGTLVRVRRGVRDPNYCDRTIGGWSGEIIAVDADQVAPYLVRWSWETLQAVDAAYRAQCEQDDFALEEMWLAEADLLVLDASPGEVDLAGR